MDNSVLLNPVVIFPAVGCVGFAALLVVCSIGAVPPLEYGIRYNYFSKNADVEKVYYAGRHFIGPWNSFLLFPAAVQSIEFTNEAGLKPSGTRFPALHTRTKEGLALHMQVSLQYKLTEKLVGKLYKEFNRNYEVMFTSVIRDTLIKVAADYEAEQLWKERQKVGENMQNMVNEALQETYAECWGLQLMVIELPKTFDSSIVSTQVQRQNISTMEYSQAAAQIRAQTSVIQADFAAKVKVIKAHGHANYTLTTRTARAHARRKILLVEAEVLESIKAKLHVIGDDLVEYQQFTAVQSMQNASLYYGFDEGSQVLVKQAPFRALGAADPNALSATSRGMGISHKEEDSDGHVRRLLESMQDEIVREEL